TVALHPASAGPGTPSAGASGAPGTPGSQAGPGANPDGGTTGGTEAGRTPTVTPSTPPPPGPVERPVKFPDLHGVMIDVPNGWVSLAVLTGKPPTATGYLASQPLDTRTACPLQQQGCVPVNTLSDGTLSDGGTLITLRLVGDSSEAKKIYGYDGPAVATEVDKTCRGWGGTAQLVGHRAVILDSGMAVIELSACLNGSSVPGVQKVQQLLDTLRYTGDAPVAPGSTRG
ncbi:hypothetical protein ABZ885_36455, partial [Kitasatospora sp. NPDC047058]